MATVELSWTDNASSEDGFYIYRSTTSSPSFPGDYSQIDSVGTDITTYSDSNAPDDTTVYYAVTAFNSNGESSATKSNVTTPAAAQSISAPELTITSSLVTPTTSGNSVSVNVTENTVSAVDNTVSIQATAPTQTITSVSSSITLSGEIPQFSPGTRSVTPTTAALNTATEQATFDGYVSVNSPATTLTVQDVESSVVPSGVIVNAVQSSISVTDAAPFATPGSTSVLTPSQTLSTGLNSSSITTGANTFSIPETTLTAATRTPSITGGSVTVTPTESVVTLSTLSPTGTAGITIEPNAISTDITIPAPASSAGSVSFSVGPQNMQTDTTGVQHLSGGAVSISAPGNTLATLVNSGLLQSGKFISPTPITLDLTTEERTFSGGPVTISTQSHILSSNVPTADVDPAPVSISSSASSLAVSSGGLSTGIAGGVISPSAVELATNIRNNSLDGGVVEISPTQSAISISSQQPVANTFFVLSPPSQDLSATTQQPSLAFLKTNTIQPSSITLQSVTNQTNWTADYSVAVDPLEVTTVLENPNFEGKLAIRHIFDIEGVFNIKESIEGKFDTEYEIEGEIKNTK